MVGVIGGIIGLVLTFLGTYYLDRVGITMNVGSNGGSPLILKIYPSLSMTDVLTALIIAIITGIIAGIYPALKAAKLTVIEAIRRD